MYNLQNYINKLEELKEWDFPFERFKHIEEVKKEEEEPKIEELKDESKPEDVVSKLQKPSKSIRLDTVVEGGDESKDAEGERKLLKAFEILNVQFHFLAD